MGNKYHLGPQMENDSSFRMPVCNTLTSNFPQSAKRVHSRKMNCLLQQPAKPLGEDESSPSLFKQPRFWQSSSRDFKTEEN